MTKIKFIKQRDSMQCGASCLTMICNYLGMNCSLEDVSEICSATTEGVSLLAISKASLQLGLKAIGVKTSVEGLLKCDLPIILHWDQNHFVVLYRIKNNKFYIANPGKGLYKCSRDEFVQHWESIPGNNTSGKGIALLFEKTEEFNHIAAEFESRNRHRAPSLKFVIRYMSDYRRYFVQIFAGLIIGCLLQLILPFLTQSIVDIGIKYNDIHLIWLILIGELMIVLGRTATDFIRRWLLLHISMRINISLISDFFIKLLKLPMSFFDTKLMGDLLQRMNDHYRVQSFLTGQTLGIFFSILSFSVFGIVLFIYNSLIFAIFIAGSIVYGIWIASFLSRRKIIDYELFEQQAINQNKTYQFITSMQEIKLQDCENRRRWEWEDVQADLFTIQMKSLKLQQTQEAGSIFINELKNILITVFAATAVINGEITLGAMLAIQYIVGQLNSPIEQIMNFVYSLQDVKISLERINEIHQGKNEESPANSATSFTDNKEIIIDNINFKYNPNALKNTLSGVSIKIPAGKVTAIVGASGSGKTTLIKLMLGYYKVSDGKIEIAGRNISNYSLKWWRRQCGVVMQDGVIFSESIARNIAVDDNEINTEKLYNAAEIANIHEYIQSLPLRYDTKIGRDGVGLSQGQKQRILIARAVYKNPDFIFLDEATNALDAKNERTIVQNLDKFYEGKTVVIVAHRLSTVKNADNIIVIDNGTVVETGNHTSLITRKGTYYNLIKNQLELGN